MTETPEEIDGYFESYKQFSNILRSWLIAYGIGAPILILSQEHIWNALGGSGKTVIAGCLFLAGVLLQVIFAAFFKWAMWVIWMATDEPKRKKTKSYKLAHWASEKYFIDFITDVGAMLLFGVGTAILFFDMINK